MRRHYIPKTDGTKRPLGIPTFEDKVAQRAILMLLGPIYEADFLPCSYGFRPKRSAHDALDALRKGIIEQRQRWVIDADLKSCFEEAGMTVMVIGGPNRRTDFHDGPVEEFFYQLEGDMVLKVAEAGRIYDVPIRAGEVLMLPPHVPHSPQRPVPGSVGLVVESPRAGDMLDGFEWFCFACGGPVHRVEVAVGNIVTDLPPLFEAFYADERARLCGACGAPHPGREPPAGWAAV